jgi:hypothetical protein
VLCRPRDKVNRPQTRRRRENTEDCYDKLKQMKDNLTAVRSIVDEIVRRERRKRDLMVRGCVGGWGCVFVCGGGGGSTGGKGVGGVETGGVCSGVEVGRGEA